MDIGGNNAAKTKKEKQMRRILVSIAVLAVFSAYAAVSADAAEVARYSSKGASASAGWSGLDGCVQTEVNVFVADNIVQVGGGAPTGSATAFVAVWQYDVCSAAALHDIFGFSTLNPNEFAGSKRLDGATLMTSVAGYDYATASSVTLSLDLDFEPNGTVSKGFFLNNSWFNGGAYFLSQRGKGSFRSAVADGVVSDGAVNYAVGPSDFGQLAYTTSSSLTVSK